MAITNLFKKKIGISPKKFRENKIKSLDPRDIREGVCIVLSIIC